MNELSVGACVKYGWETFKKRPWFIIGAVVITGILTNVPSAILQNLDPKGESPLAILLSIGLSFFGIAVQIVLTRFWLKAHDAVETVRYEEALPPRPYWKYFGSSFVMSLAVFVGLILLIIPGIIVALAFMFAPYLVVEKKLWPIESLKESARITKGYRWKLFLLCLALIGINILGLLALVVGLLVSFPVSMFALVHAYRTLEAKQMPAVV